MYMVGVVLEIQCQFHQLVPLPQLLHPHCQILTPSQHQFLPLIKLCPPLALTHPPPTVVLVILNLLPLQNLRKKSHLLLHPQISMALSQFLQYQIRWVESDSVFRAEYMCSLLYH